MKEMKRASSTRDHVRLSDVNRWWLSPHSPYVGSFKRQPGGTDDGDTSSPEALKLKGRRFLQRGNSCKDFEQVDGTVTPEMVNSWKATRNQERKREAASVARRYRSKSISTEPWVAAALLPTLSENASIPSAAATNEDGKHDELRGFPAKKETSKPKPRMGKRTQSFNSLSDFQGVVTPELSKMQAMLPKSFGVQIEKKIGEGTFAKVVVALNKRNNGMWKDPIIYRKLISLPKEGEKLVLKCVKKQEGSDAGNLGEYQNEVSLHTACRHPNIPRMYGFYDDGENLTIIMDFVPDATELRDLMNLHHILPEPRLRVISLQTMRAVSYLHDKGIAHRDISPRNILEQASGRTFLIDLGLAVDVTKPLDPSIPQGPQVGTLGYMAPESQLPDRNDHYRAGDVWGVGCILYECLFGISPFLPHELHMPDKHVQFPGKEWGMDSSPQVCDLICKMLVKDPRERVLAKDALSAPFFTPEAVAAADAAVSVVAGDGPGDGEEEGEWDWEHDLVGSGQKVTRHCLAVDLVQPAGLEPKVGEHVNFTATVFMQKNAESCPSTPLPSLSSPRPIPSPLASPAGHGPSSLSTSPEATPFLMGGYFPHAASALAKHSEAEESATGSGPAARTL